MRTIQLTDQQRAFVTHYTSDPGAIGNGSEAARRAGYSSKCAGEMARQLLEKRHVRDAIDQANREAVSGRIASKAVALLERVIDDEAAPVKARVEAAKTILDRAGLVAPSIAERLFLNQKRNGSRKVIADMTVEEIRDEILRLQSETAELEQLAPPQGAEFVIDGEAAIAED